MINRHKVFFVSVVFFLLLSMTVFSQNSKIDSLKNIVETGTKDTSMVSTLNTLSIEVLNNENIPESIIYSEKAKELANQLNYKKGKAYALKNIGLAQYYQGDFIAVLDHWTRSLETFEAINDTLGIATIVNNLGAVYYSQGSHAKALDYYLRSLSISEKVKDPFRISQALLNIGGLYAEMLNYEKALEYFNKIEKYRALVNDPKINSHYLMGIGEIYYEQGFYDDALKYYEEALNNSNINERPNNLIKLGLVELKRRNKEKAINFLNEGYSIAKNNNQKFEVVQALIALASVYKENNYKKAITEYKEAEVLAKEVDANDELRDIYEGLYQTFEIKGDYENAFKYQNLYLRQKDSIFNLATDDKIRGLQFDFDLEKKQDEIGLLEKEAEISELEGRRQKVALYSIIGFAVIILFLAIGLLNRYKFVNKTKKIIEDEKNKSDNLLLNILPFETATELKEYGKVKAKKFDSVTVLFTDFKNFTQFSTNLSPEELVKSVDYYFSKFDEIIDRYDLEKIKTIGDAYMCAGGLPFESDDHSVRMIMAAFEISKFVTDSKELKNSDAITHFDVRIGLNTGPVVAGVVGTKKFAYDIWGDTVNVASRMESMSEAGRINISEDTYELVKNIFNCSYRGEIVVKNRGTMKMYFVDSVKNKDLLPVFDKKLV